MKPNYNYSHLVMLLTCQVILKNLVPVLALFTQRLSTLTAVYVEKLDKRIQTGLQKISTDKYFVQKNATKEVKSIVDRALKNLRAFYTDLKVVFAKDKPLLETILQTFGFNKWYVLASRGKQEAITAILMAIKENIEPYRQQLIEAGMNAEAIDALVADADPLDKANVAQESIMGSRPVLTRELQTELNDIYTEVIAICTLGKSIYNDDPVSQKLFSFRAIAEGLENKRDTKPDNGTPA